MFVTTYGPRSAAFKKLLSFLPCTDNEMRRMNGSLEPDLEAEDRDMDEANQVELAGMLSAIGKHFAATDLISATVARHQSFSGHGRTYVKLLVDEEIFARLRLLATGVQPEAWEATQWRLWIVAKLASIHN